MTSRLAALLVVGVSLLVGPAVAATAPGLVVQQARIRWLPGDLPMAGYFTAVNPTRRTIVITSFSSTAFAVIAAHETTSEDGGTRMKPLANLKITAAQPLILAPGGKHLMLMHRRRALHVGEQVQIDFILADHRHVPVRFEVVTPGALP